MKITTKKNKKLDDDKVVEECMDLLMKDYPSIAGYTYERIDSDVIQILMWGDFTVV